MPSSCRRTHAARKAAARRLQPSATANTTSATISCTTRLQGVRGIPAVPASQGIRFPQSLCRRNRPVQRRPDQAAGRNGRRHLLRPRQHGARSGAEAGGNGLRQQPRNHRNHRRLHQRHQRQPRLRRDYRLRGRRYRRQEHQHHKVGTTGRKLLSLHVGKHQYHRLLAGRAVEPAQERRSLPGMGVHFGHSRRQRRSDQIHFRLHGHYRIQAG